MKKKNDLFKIIAIGIGVLVVGTLVYIFGFTSLIYSVVGGKASEAIANGRVEIMSSKDFDKYFVSLPIDRVTVLLEESGEMFLFPQVDLGIAEDKSFVVTEQEIQPEGDINPTAFITISGLPEGTKIYSSASGLIRGWIIPGDGVSYAWSREALLKDNPNGASIIYFPAIDLGTVESNPFEEWVEPGAYSSVGIGTHYATISVSETIPESFIPGGVSLAMAVAKDGEKFTDFSLDKILTYKGRIVMIER
jgi:hypothetical protein